MAAETHSRLANFIWSICNLLRGPYKRNEYRRVILPLTVLRRFDYMLANPPFGKAAKEKLFQDRKAFLAEVRTLDRARDVRLSAPELKAGLAALGERDDTAEICRDRDGQPEPDPDLRDTETVPLKESIEAYFKREVLPHVPDVWIDHSKTKVGYEIPLNRHFYRYEPPRPLEVIEADIKRLEAEIKLTGVAKASLKELLEDYRDFMRNHGITEWPSDHRYALRLRQLNRTPNANYETFRKGIEHPDPAICANVIAGLIKVTCYLLDQQLRRLEQDFLKEGGLRERMTRARLAARRRQGGLP